MISNKTLVSEQSFVNNKPVYTSKWTFVALILFSRQEQQLRLSREAPQAGLRRNTADRSQAQLDIDPEGSRQTVLWDVLTEEPDLGSIISGGCRRVSIHCMQGWRQCSVLAHWLFRRDSDKHVHPWSSLHAPCAKTVPLLEDTTDWSMPVHKEVLR